MARDTLTNTTPGSGGPRRPLTSEQLRLRRRLLVRVVATFFVLALPAFWIFNVGNNRWRVQLHHGVNLPTSARAFQCSGHTAFTAIFGGSSSARFTIDAAELQQFLSQFRVGPPMPRPNGGYPTFGAPSSQPISSEGHIGGPSPTGRDHYGLKWQATPEGVQIELQTSWN
jgi:hypothetical protein